MDYFASLGFDCWLVDMEGYGRSTKDRDNNAPIAYGAEDCFAAATYIQKLRGPRPLLVYGIPFIIVVLSQLGVNPELIAIILGVDRILDMCRTTLNVTGDLTIAFTLMSATTRCAASTVPIASAMASFAWS